VNDSTAKNKAPRAISSPEQLDQLLQVTRPGGWIALGALCLVLLAAIVWSVLGRIPTKVDGVGMLIRPGGVLDVVSLGQGQVSAIKVGSGDMVAQGQVVAELFQPSLQAQIASARQELGQLTKQRQTLGAFYEKQDKLQQQLLTEQRKNLRAAMDDIDVRLNWLEKRVGDQQKLLDQGLITSQTMMDTKSQVMSAKEQKRQHMVDLKDLEEGYLKFQDQQERDLAQSDLSVLQSRGRLELLESDLSLRSRVISQYAGRVLELKARVGAEVDVGTPLFSVERLDKDLVTVAYAPAAQGKRIKKGMTIEITPSTVKRDEYGYMIGRVTDVSPFPATDQGMMAVLQNQELVSEFSKAGAPITVYAAFERDGGTYSGYKWSSKKGPPQKIYSGTVCTVQVVVDEQPPIQLVIPYFKSLLGL